MQLGTGGTFVAIRNNGSLYWYRYLGAGESDVGGSQGWEFGSGTEIGHGWQSFEHVLMYYNNGDHLILLGVQADGTMRAYFYTYGQGWHAGSGDVIGHGWNGFQRLIGTTSTIFGVTDNGDLRWYQFVEHGWPRPPGNWPLKPNSGNVIGTGWTFAHLVVGGFDNSPSTSPTLCGVDTVGNVRWYRYWGSGGPETSSDWHPNSGSVISGSW
jgi:DNA-directed RNA polymerase subunit N (RpoN/RPB10)